MERYLTVIRDSIFEDLVRDHQFLNTFENLDPFQIQRMYDIIALKHGLFGDEDEDEEDELHEREDELHKREDELHEREEELHEDHGHERDGLYERDGELHERDGLYERDGELHGRDGLYERDEDHGHERDGLYERDEDHGHEREDELHEREDELHGLYERDELHEREDELHNDALPAYHGPDADVDDWKFEDHEFDESLDGAHVEFEKEATRQEQKRMGYWNEKIFELMSVDMTEDPDEGTPRVEAQEQRPTAFAYGVSDSAKAKARARYNSQGQRYEDQCMDLEKSRSVDLTRSLGK
jgi:hypothetical protein